MRRALLLLFVAIAARAAAPPMVYPECNDGNVDTMDYCGGDSSNPVWCNDDYNDQGAHAPDGTSFTGTCVYVTRPLRISGTPVQGLCNVALGWFGAQVPESVTEPFLTFDYEQGGTRFLPNIVSPSSPAYTYKADPGGAGGYVWAPTNVNNAPVVSCPDYNPSAIGALSTETHSVSFTTIPGNGCGFKHGLPLDTDKNAGLLIEFQYYPYTEYIVRVYWSPNDIASPPLASALDYLGCVDHTSNAPQECINAGYDPVGKNSLYLVVPKQGNGLVQVNIVKDGPLQPGMYPRGELWVIFDPIGAPSSPPSIDSVMFMYLNLCWNVPISDCRYNQLCMASEAGYTDDLTQKTDYGTAVLPVGFDNPCGYDGDQCIPQVCNGRTGTCDTEGYTDALMNAPACTDCDPGDRIVSYVGCMIQAFSYVDNNLVPPESYPTYSTLFENGWDSFGRLEFCNTRTVEGGDNTFTDGGRITNGAMVWTWYVGISVDPDDIQYMNGLSVSRLFPLSPTLYPNGASLEISYDSLCGSFVVSVTQIGFAPVPLYCSDTVSTTPGAGDVAQLCLSNFVNGPIVISSTPGASVTLDVSAYTGTDYYFTIAVDNDPAAIFANAPACATGAPAYVNITQVSVVPSAPTCDTGDLCEPNGQCVNGACTGTPIVCNTPACAVGSCVGGSCSYTYPSPSAVCNDNNVCSTDSCTPGGCVNTFDVICPPPPVCKLSTCEAVNGCVLSNAPDGTICPAGICEGGFCVISSTCTTNADCAYLADVCTSAFCSAGNCATSPLFGPCALSNLCELGGTCVTTMTGNRAVCTPSSTVTCNAAMDLPANELPCLQNYACNPGTGLCEATWFSTNTPCDEGDACTLIGTCDAGHVCVSPPFPCPPSDDCNTISCSGGMCVSTPQPDNTACVPPYHFACGPGVCKLKLPNLSVCDNTFQGSTCPIVVLPPDEAACLESITCDIQMGACVVFLNFRANDAYCVTGDSLCEDQGVCQNNMCVTTPVDCGAISNDCDYYTCNEMTGMCTGAPSNGSPCVPTDPCTDNGVCVVDIGNPQQANCVGIPIVCMPPPISPNATCITGFQCNDDTGLCGVTLLDNGELCDDGSACTYNDVCDYGLCRGTPITCNVPGSPGVATQPGLCNVGCGPSYACFDGFCRSSDGSLTDCNCNDGIYCNGPEQLHADGACRVDPLNIPGAGALTQCDTTYCDEATDSVLTHTFHYLVGKRCQHPSQGVCSAGMWQCVMGSLVCSNIVPEGPEVCGDGLDNNCNGVVDEGCEPLHMCNAYTPCQQIPCYKVACMEINIPECAMESSSAECEDDDDDDDDDEGDDDGKCKSPYDKAWQGPNGGLLVCQYFQKPQGTACSTPDLCAHDHTCDQYGTCVGPPGVCDDSNPATSDYCDGGICHYIHGDHTPCDDSNPCTVNDEYSAATHMCTGFPVVCKTCNQCTYTTCIAPNNCPLSFYPAGHACTDNDPCTENDVCDGAGGCAGTPVVCPSDNLPPCTLAYCGENGCTQETLPFGGPCTMGIPLIAALEANTISQCVNGKCQLQDQLLVDDVSPGCGGQVAQCTTPQECEQWMSDFIDLLAELSLTLSACTHPVYNGTTVTTPLFSLNDALTHVQLVVNKTLAYHSVSDWVERAHAEFGAFRFCEDYTDCDSFIETGRRVQAVYDILKGLVDEFQCPSLEQYGIHAVVRQPRGARFWFFQAWDDSLDMASVADYDMNDLVVAMHVVEGLDANDRPVLSDVRYEIVARGSVFNHHLKWLLKGTPCSPTTLTYSHHAGISPSYGHPLAYKWHYHPATGSLLSGPSVSVANGCLEVFHNTDQAMPVPSNLTTFANTNQGDTHILPARNAHVIVSLDYGNRHVDVDNETIFDLAFMQRYYHTLDAVGKGDIATLLVQLDAMGEPTVLNALDSMRMDLPMMQHLPCTWQWPREHVAVFDAYPFFDLYAMWLQLGGVAPPPWYDFAVNSSLIFFR